MKNTTLPLRIASRLRALRESSRRATGVRSAVISSGLDGWGRPLRGVLLLAGLTWSWGTVPAAELRAWVFEPPTSATTLTGARALLEGAGFAVAPSTSDAVPTAEEAGLIVLASFANRAPGYAEFIKQHAADLRKFVEQGGVLLQLAQQEEAQISLPFLPEGMRASRGDACVNDVRVISPGHPLLKGLGDDAGRVDLPPHLDREPSWHTFMEQSGGAVLLGAPSTDDPVMIEMAGGKGRFLLTSLFFDRLYDAGGALVAPPAYESFARAFMRNLASYVAAVKARRVPAVRVTPKPTPLAFVPGSWTLAVLPDTQYYARSYPEVFEAQTKWIAENAHDLNIKYVLHLGDITADNLEPQWQVAKRAMSRLDGVVPYALVGGNHDYGPRGNSANRESFINDYFPVAAYEKWPTFGGAMEPGKIDNTYHLFEAGGRKWIVLALEWAPRDEVVAWADDVLSAHPERFGILITHAYLSSDNTRYDWAKYGRKQSATPHNYKLTHPPSTGNDGEELWQKLVCKHPRMVMTINGHVLQDGVGRLTSEGMHGNLVHQMLVNYQRMRPQQGNGFLRLYEFLPDGETIQVRSYSPVWDVFKTDTQNQFLLKISPPVR